MRVKRIGLVALVVTSSLMGYGQTAPRMQAKLDSMFDVRSQFNKTQTARAVEYASKNGVPLSYYDSRGNFVLLIGVSDSGVPLYKSTDNAGAAITTGVDKLREGGGLGLNLTGQQMQVAVWDGGLVKPHTEFGNRILSTQGSTPDNHATHVTGTILATGLNPMAKGMAPNAEAFTFDFNNDEPEMIAHAKPDETTTLLSNHSYGLISGWNFNAGSWTWFGDAGISNQEDFKFGYYSQNAKLWDEIAFNAPYYTICKSAGNERTDSGSGGFPADCNGGTGYDCLGDVSVSKNIVTVGAVRKLASYTGPASVQMATFSSWGPTDDGRIKPDFVAAGVDLFSTSGVGENQYTQLSGTSMATPNATGSLLLIQELYKKLHGNKPMRAATLKSLAIHSVKEAGPAVGPDYSFGWGLLDVGKAAEIILAEDGSNTRIIEDILSNSEVLTIELDPKPATKITATISWTDPAGNPVAPALDPTNIMLVNDLDIRIVDEANNTVFPWILDPQNPGANADKGNNIRDNVEKIEFENPSPRKYFVKVSHKGTLQGGQQHFSLVLTYTSNNDTRTAYYWIGNSGNWNDPAHWSLTSGGPTANAVPAANTRVFFDENSFSSSNRTITLQNNSSCASLTWLATESTTLAFNNHSLTVAGNFTLSNSNLSGTGTGTMIFDAPSASKNSVTINANDFSTIDFKFQSDAEWQWTGNGSVKNIEIQNGHLISQGNTIEVEGLNSNGPESKTLDISNSTVSALNTISFDDENLTLIGEDAEIVSANTSVTLDFGTNGFNGALKLTNGGELFGSGHFEAIEINGDLHINGNNSIGNFKIAAGASLVLESGTTQTLTQDVEFLSTSAAEISIESSDASKATLHFDGYFKICFDDLNITGVDVTGDAVVNAGPNSEVTNSSNWLTEICNEILFPDFTVSFVCVGARTEFNDASLGDVTDWTWDFGDPGSSGNTSDKQNAAHTFLDEGSYDVTLTVSDGNTERSHTKTIQILANALPENEIILSGQSLFSSKASATYQWFKNDELIAGANQRVYSHGGEPGEYVVMIKDDACNRVSAPYIILSAEDEISSGVKIYPNPVGNSFKVDILSAFERGKTELKIINSLGQPIAVHTIFENGQEINAEHLMPGVYIVKVNTSKKSIVKKIIK